MQVYMLQAALICDHCASEFMANTPKPDHVVYFPNLNEYDESSYDSDEWPKGPYPDGGGEADTPQHCDHCGEFLDNPLTPDGEECVRDAFRRYVLENRGSLFETLKTWKESYSWVFDDYESIDYPELVSGGLGISQKQRAAALAAL